MAKRLRAWKAEYLVLTRPLGRVTAETGNSKSARQATFDGRFDQIGCEEGQRDRHIDLADAAFFAGGDLFETRTRALAFQCHSVTPFDLFRNHLPLNY